MSAWDEYVEWDRLTGSMEDGSITRTTHRVKVSDLVDELQCRVGELSFELDAIKRAGGWRPIETLDNDGQKFDLYGVRINKDLTESFDRVCDVRYENLNGRTSWDARWGVPPDHRLDYFRATHWRPLPDPPT